jgi:hypothetical protein
MSVRPAAATAQEQAAGEALACAVDQLRRARSAISATLCGEVSTRRTIVLARAYDQVGRTLNELVDLQ